MKHLNRKLARLDASTERLLDELSLVPSPLLEREPAPGAWTPLQALNHVYLAERSCVDYLLYKRDSGEELPPLTLRARGRGVALRVSQALPLKFRAPAAIDVSANAALEARDLDALAADYRAMRAEMHALLEAYPEDWRRRAVLKHAVAGRVGIGATVGFFRTHFARHARQIRRALAQNLRDTRRGSGA